MTSFYFQGLRKCFLEIITCLEGLLAALFISVSNRYQKKIIYLLFATGLKITKMCFRKGGGVGGGEGGTVKVCNKNMFDKT